MNGRILGTKPLYVALAQRKEERKAILTNQYMQRLSTVRALGGPLLGSFHQPTSYFLPSVPQPPAQAAYYASGLPMQPTPRWTAPPPRPSSTYPPAASVVRPPAMSRRPPAQVSSVRQASTQVPPPVPHTQRVANIGTQTTGASGVGYSTPGGPLLTHRYPSATHNHGVQEPAVRILGQEPLTASMLAAAPLHEQKQMIGGGGFGSAAGTPGHRAGESECALKPDLEKSFNREWTSPLNLNQGRSWAQVAGDC